MKNLNSLFLSLIILLTVQACCRVKPPQAVLPVPSQSQIDWQKMETYAFVHFGLNTFNDLEWGYGDTPASTFNPTNLDCEQWVRIIKAAGLKGVILTAKHHDGFCLWPTKTVDYNISQSPYKDGKGDMVRELSDACKKHGLKFGLYLSPWDRHHKEYGYEGYQKVYHAQINELISNYGDLFEFWFDGANGGNGWYGGANEKRSIDSRSYYGYEKARDMIKSKHPDAIIFGGTAADIRWVGNEQGWAGETNWSMFDAGKVSYRRAPWGTEGRGRWLPAECDVSVRPGWFYHPREDSLVRIVPNLVDLYYRSVGHNATLLLNFPIALNGQIHPVDSARVVDWYKVIQTDFKKDLLANSEPIATSTRGYGYDADLVADGDWDSYWATPDSVSTGALTFNFSEPTSLNRVLVQEYIPLGQRVGKFSIEVLANNSWQSVETNDTLTTIGYKRIVRFKTVTAEALRVSFIRSRGPLCINTVQAFLAPALLQQPSIRRNADNQVLIELSDKNIDIYYTLDGSVPTVKSTKYTSPFEFTGKTIVKAVAYDVLTKKYGPIASKRLDLLASDYKVVRPKIQAIRNLFDDEKITFCNFPKGEKELIIKLKDAQVITGFSYMPNVRSSQGYISQYQFFVDGKKVAEGEFSNIKNNPISREIHFEPIKGKVVKLKCVKMVDNVQSIGFSEFSLITK